jgi:CheY-like chemotaxis protein
MQKYNLSQINVLIVDGNWNMRRLISTALEGYGIQNIEFAADGREALNKLSTFTADLVICEYRLGHVNGVELTRKIRRSRAKYNPYVPILLLTAHTVEKVVASARDAGISGVIAKPVSPEYLLRHIVELIERPRQFVRSPDFFGPDRRARGKDRHTDIPRRRASDKLLHRPGARTAPKTRRIASLQSNIRVKQPAVA